MWGPIIYVEPSSLTLCVSNVLLIESSREHESYIVAFNAIPHLPYQTMLRRRMKQPQLSMTNVQSHRIKNTFSKNSIEFNQKNAFYFSKLKILLSAQRSLLYMGKITYLRPSLRQSLQRNSPKNCWNSLCYYAFLYNIYSGQNSMDYFYVLSLGGGIQA